MNDPETWLPVVGYEGLYEVSDQGRVRSLDRTVERPNARSGGRVQPRQGGLLSLFRQNRQGHLQVRLSRDGIGTSRSVHRLVLEAFVGPCEPGQFGLHTNDIANDNRLVNLRWGTNSDNQRDSVRNGNHPNARKTHCKRNHEFSPENTRYATNGSRVCKHCRNEERRKTHV